MKILTILGARPQFIKASAVSRAISACKDLEEKIVHTGQHFDRRMSQIFFEEMAIPRPHYELNINSLSHGAMTGRMLEHIEEIFRHEKPRLVLVYGDTNSTLAGALAASKLHIPVAHVEAGLRSFNMQMPEEINRILTDRISRFLFCPTQEAAANLRQEGYDNFPCLISCTGDVMLDALQYYARQIPAGPLIKQPYALLTLHRQENTDNPERLKAIVEALNRLAGRFRLVFPVHPRTAKKLQEYGLHLQADHLEPVGYLAMLHLLRHASLVLTDSGGLQKEAYMMNKYCITLRDETEWVELVTAGSNRLAGADSEKIVSMAEALFGQEITTDSSIYGNGRAAEKICRLIRTRLG